MKLRKSILLLILFALFFLLVTVLADKGLIPTTLKSIPHYDSIGHFVLFGIYAFLAQKAFNERKFYFLPIGSSLVAIYATTDEFLQKLSPNRSFDLNDLFFSISGVLVFTYYKEIYKFLQDLNKKHHRLLPVTLSVVTYFYGLFGFLATYFVFSYYKKIPKENRTHTKQAVFILALMVVYKLFLEWTMVDVLTVFFSFVPYLIAIPTFLVYFIWNIVRFFKQKSKDIKIALLINLITIISFALVPFTLISLGLDFYTKLPFRTYVVEKVKSGELKQDTDSSLTNLPTSSPSLSAGGNSLLIEDGKIFFFTFRGILDNYSGFIYTENDDPTMSAEEIIQTIKLWKHWYFVAFT